MIIHSKLAVIGLAAGIAVAAQAMTPGMQEHFRAFDSDHNGRLSVAELDAAAAQIFARADADHDGSLTVAELRALHGSHGGAPMAHEGAGPPAPMSLAAFQAHLRAMTTRADANRDGEISMEEAEAMHASMRHGG
jgi:Ca2+-binding EF-hand superfamily protein